MKKVFEIVFERINKIRLESEICVDFWSKLLRLKGNYNESECWDLLFDNIEWLVNKNIIKTLELIEWFSEKELSDHNIYFKGSHVIKNNKAIGIGNCYIEASGHSKVILFDSARCEGFDTSFVTCFNNSKATVKDCIVNGFHNAKIVVKGFGLCEAWDDCIVVAENKSVVRKNENVSVSAGVGCTVI
ncbi:hypothetical protein [Joostella sp.]|uniref:hypothetical protein n=1 Tax=Joostella sp. TaxID=2231138 RepID=UPI003A8E125D